MRRSKKKDNVGRRFSIFVKIVDDNGYVDEEKCGWLNFNNQKKEPRLCFSLKDAMVFVEKEDGHGSYSDWKKMFEEDHQNWKLPDSPKYLD